MNVRVVVIVFLVLVLFLLSHSFFALMHEVSVFSDFLDLSITFIFLLSFLINLKQFLLPFYFHDVK